HPYPSVLGCRTPDCARQDPRYFGAGFLESVRPDCCASREDRRRDGPERQSLAAERGATPIQAESLTHVGAAALLVVYGRARLFVSPLRAGQAAGSRNHDLLGLVRTQ